MLQISRVDHVKPPEINNLTYSLRRKAEEMGGVFDGWETSLVR
ncbi:MAG: ribonuclease E inhibitor RraB [Flavobacteriales bacterium]|nr:ribonuclease E inhibitor RraB [Flavobacteriales bacterium]